MTRHNQSSWSLAVVAFLFILLPRVGFTLGFGQIKLYSYLNEPIEAEIELLGAENIDPAYLMVSLASSQEFKKTNLARPYFLTKLRFKVIKENARTVIQVTSHEPVKVPSLEFLVVIQGSMGRFMRGYTLLFDPVPLEAVRKRRPLHSTSLEIQQIQRLETAQAQDRALAFSQRKSSPNDALLKQPRMASANARMQSTTPITDVPPRTARNDSALDEFEHLFQSDATPEGDKKTDVTTTQSAQAVSIESPLPLESSTTALSASAPTAEEEAENSVISGGSLWSAGFDKDRWLLGSGLGLLICVGVTVLWLKRARETLPVPVSSTIPDLESNVEIFDNELRLKLDLAKQYMMIQDSESAAEILQEVILRGNTREIEVAQGLLAKMRTP